MKAAALQTATIRPDLAVFGSRPRFDEPLHVGRPNIGDRARFQMMVEDMLERRWLTNNGPYVRQFEANVAELLGVRHCIAMCNGTVALEIAIRAAGLKGEVIIPSFTFVALPHALQWQEINPIFCDIDPSTHTIDPDCIEDLITPRTTGIIGVHLWGNPCNTEALTEIAARRGLQLLFDASHAFACGNQGMMIGNFGRAEVFSFHATKFVNCLEGGAVVTNDDALAGKIRYMKNFGFSGYDDVRYLGTNGKMDEMSAAMGLVNLESCSEFIHLNRHNRACYTAGIRDIRGIRLLEFRESSHGNYQYVVLEVDEAESGLSRDELIKVLHAENVLARRYFWPGCHRMEPYRTLFPDSHARLPHTEEVASRVLVLPTGSAVGAEHIEGICSIMKTAMENASLVHEALEAQ